MFIIHLLINKSLFFDWEGAIHFSYFLSKHSQSSFYHLLCKSVWWNFWEQTANGLHIMSEFKTIYTPSPCIHCFNYLNYLDHHTYGQNCWWILPFYLLYQVAYESFLFTYYLDMLTNSSTLHTTLTCLRILPL